MAKPMFEPKYGTSKAASHPARADAMSSATAHRVDQQIKRAFRHTYNAEAGLRTLVVLGAAEMLRAGATREHVRSAMIARVQNHPGDGKPSLVTGESRADSITRLMLAWGDEACERFHASATDEVAR